MIQRMQPVADIITVESNVQFPISDFLRGYQFLQLFHKAIGKKNSSGLNANNDRIIQLQMIFQHLMAKPLNGDG